MLYQLSYSRFWSRAKVRAENQNPTACVAESSRSRAPDLDAVYFSGFSGALARAYFYLCFYGLATSS